MEKLGICVVGTGRAGMVHAGNFAHSISEAELVAMVDKDESKAKSGADKLGVTNYYSELEKALNDPGVNAVCIATPTFTHSEIAVAAAKEGKHILCEKPLAIDPEEVNRISEALNEEGVTFMIGFMRRFDESFLEAKKKIERGVIGRPITVKSTGRGPGLPPSWAWDPELSNGNLAEVNSHDFDSIRWLTGEEFTRVFTRGGNYKTPRVKEDFPGFYDNAIVSFEMSNGIIGTVDGTCPADYGYDARMEILGTEGVLFIGEVAKKGLSVCTSKEGLSSPAVESWQSLFETAYLREDKHFVQSVLSHTAPRVTLEDGRKALEVVLASNRSLEKQVEVEL